MLGQWFNTIALFLLILEYTGSEFLLGLLFTVRMAGFAVLQPLIGLLADRYNRKRLMVISNILQAGFALCFLLVNDANDIVWMIGLSGVMMILHGVYMTAERHRFLISSLKKIWRRPMLWTQPHGQQRSVSVPCSAALLYQYGAPMRRSLSIPSRLF